MSARLTKATDGASMADAHTVIQSSREPVLAVYYTQAKTRDVSSRTACRPKLDRARRSEDVERTMQERLKRLFAEMKTLHFSVPVWV